LEDGESLSEALVRESQEKAGVIPTRFSFLVSIADPDPAQNGSVIYHLFAVTAWENGEPHPVGDEHTEFQWFLPTEAIVLPDLALQEYKPVFSDMARLGR
jgi:8-oxo-dGTP pyrophosphatase MutT (NUDIX family)